MEWFKTDVDDKSKAVGGKQRLLTLEGYVIPFEVSSGLVYMKPLGIPTDDDMDQYPHVFMTDPHEWDPGVMDYKYESREDWENLGYTSRKDAYHEPRFDAYGESTQCVIANLDFLLDEPPPLAHCRDKDDSTCTWSCDCPHTILLSHNLEPHSSLTKLNPALLDDKWMHLGLPCGTSPHPLPSTV